MTEPDGASGRTLPTRKSGDEAFHSGGAALPFDLRSYWQWAASDLLTNTQRGVVAEYLVAQAVGAAAGVRTEWDAYDVLSPAGTRIEVKASGYIQAWKQSEYSRIQFDIARKREWDAASNTLSATPVRSADVYVFALLAHRDPKTIDPLDVAQWEFFVLATAVLERERPEQKSITLGALKSLGPRQCRWAKLGEAVETATKG